MKQTSNMSWLISYDGNTVYVFANDFEAYKSWNYCIVATDSIVLHLWIILTWTELTFPTKHTTIAALTSTFEVQMSEMRVKTWARMHSGANSTAHIDNTAKWACFLTCDDLNHDPFTFIHLCHDAGWCQHVNMNLVAVSSVSHNILWPYTNSPISKI